MKKTDKRYTELAKLRGEQLKNCRKKKKITQEKLAKKLGYEPDSYVKKISAYEHGRELLSDNKCYQFAEALEVNPDYLLGKSTSMGKINPYLLNDSGDNSLENEIIKCMTLLGHTIKACIIPIYETPKKKLTVNIFELKNIDFDRCLCKFETNDIIKEVAITDIQIDNKVYPVTAFRMLLFYSSTMIDSSVKSFQSFFIENALYCKQANTNKQIIEEAKEGNTGEAPDLIPIKREELYKLSESITRPK